MMLNRTSIIKKERTESEHSGNNFLTVLTNEKNMTVQQAADHCGDHKFKSLVNMFQENKRILPSFGSGLDGSEGRFKVRVRNGTVDCWKYCLEFYYGVLRIGA